MANRAAWLRSSGKIHLAGQAVVYGAAGTLGKAAALLTVPYLTRQLSPEGYGLADLATSFAALVALVVRFGGEVPAARLTARAGSAAERKALMGTYVAVSVAVAAFAALAILPLSSGIAHSFWASPENTALAATAVLLIPFSAAEATVANVLRLESRSRAFARVAVADLVAKLVMVVGLVAIGYGPTGVVVGFLLGSAIGIAAAVWEARSLVSVTFDSHVARVLILQGLPFLPALAAFMFADTLCRIVAAGLLGLHDVGQLALAIRIGSVATLGATAFSLAWGPRGLGLVPSAQTSIIYGKVIVSYSTLAFIATIGLSALAPELVLLIGGSDFVEAAVAVPGLLMAGAVSGLIYVLVTAAGIHHRRAPVAVSSVAGAAIQFIGTIALIPHLGVMGFSIAALAGRLVTSFWLTAALFSTIGQAARVLPLLVLAAIAAVAGVQVLIGQPDHSLPARLGVAAASMALSLWTAGRALRAEPQAPGGDDGRRSA